MQKKNDVRINIPSGENRLLAKALKVINSSSEIKTLWRVINVNAIDRLNMSDHGPVHFQIVANIALKFTRMLIKAKVEMGVVKNYELTNDHAELVVFLASLLHDLGMTIERKGHEEFSLFLANNLLREILAFLPTEERVIVTSETLHAIISHRAGGKPLTPEAGIVRVADALDMSKGRSRIPYEAGDTGIHSVSAAAIDSVNILPGVKKPIRIEIAMNNSAGLFQVDELLRSKLLGSGIESYVEVVARVTGATEKKLLKEIVID